MLNDIKAKQKALENEGLDGMKQLEIVIEHLSLADNSTKTWNSIYQLVNKYTTQHSQRIVQEWWNLFLFSYCILS